MSFELLCMGLIGLIFGTVVVFGGYRLFLVLIPIWGFFFGLGLGAQTVQAIFGGGFLATVTSWVVGFIVAVIFALLSYMFYILAVAIISGTFGYSLMVGLLAAIGLQLNFLVWILGIIAGIVVAVIVLRFNIQKYAIIVITAVGGAGAIIFTLLAATGGVNVADLIGNPVMRAIDNSPLWLLFFLIVAGAGIVFQIRANQNWEIESYNRMAEA